MTFDGRILVEGSTDRHVLHALLTREFSQRGCSLRKGVNDVPNGERSSEVLIAIPRELDGEADGDSGVIKVIGLQVLTAEVPTAFVVDADLDTGVSRRWESIKSKLKKADFTESLPEEMPTGGFVGTKVAGSVPIGVWIMPDNLKPGTLETFLSRLVVSDDGLFEHARQSTEKAVGLGAKFSPNHTDKANLYCWLAWQRPPGLPFGQAVTKGYFSQIDDPLAKSFLEWCLRVFFPGS